ncbi:hypothetical protein GCM10010193_34920 [Kitasatospora atroaurantiaca]
MPFSNATADALAAAVRPLVVELRVEPLGGDSGLWGGPVGDERYALVARVRRARPRAVSDHRPGPRGCPTGCQILTPWLAR